MIEIETITFAKSTYSSSIISEEGNNHITQIDEPTKTFRPNYSEAFKPRKIPKLPIPPKSPNYSFAQQANFKFPNQNKFMISDAVAYPDGSTHYLIDHLTHQNEQQAPEE